MERSLSYEAVREAVYQSDVDWGDYPVESVIRQDYSGRYMYGAECFGLVLNSDGELVRVMLELAEILSEADYGDRDVAKDLAQAMRSDSMGLSNIYYFPGWTLEGAPAESEDEEWAS